MAALYATRASLSYTTAGDTIYKSCKAGADELVRDRLRCLAQERPRFGWRRLKILLKREKIIMKHKRLRRIYREESLQVRPRKKRRVRLVRGNTAPAPTKLNEEWGLDSRRENTRKTAAWTLVCDRSARLA